MPFKITKFVIKNSLKKWPRFSLVQGIQGCKVVDQPNRGIRVNDYCRNRHPTILITSTNNSITKITHTSRLYSTEKKNDAQVSIPNRILISIERMTYITRPPPLTSFYRDEGGNRLLIHLGDIVGCKGKRKENIGLGLETQAKHTDTYMANIV